MNGQTTRVLATFVAAFRFNLASSSHHAFSIVSSRSVLCCSKIAEAEAGVSVNEKKWLVMHVHVQMRLDELRGPPNPWPQICAVALAGCQPSVVPCCLMLHDQLSVRSATAQAIAAAATLPKVPLAPSAAAGGLWSVMMVAQCGPGAHQTPKMTAANSAVAAAWLH
jgi:hypothetical protein